MCFTKSLPVGVNHEKMIVKIVSAGNDVVEIHSRPSYLINRVVTIEKSSILRPGNIECSLYCQVSEQ